MKKIFSFQKLTTRHLNRTGGIFDFNYKKTSMPKKKSEKKEKMRMERREREINIYDPERSEEIPLSTISSDK